MELLASKITVTEVVSMHFEGRDQFGFECARCQTVSGLQYSNREQAQAALDGHECLPESVYDHTGNVDESVDDETGYVATAWCKCGTFREDFRVPDVFSENNPKAVAAFEGADAALHRHMHEVVARLAVAEEEVRQLARDVADDYNDALGRLASE